MATEDTITNVLDRLANVGTRFKLGLTLLALAGIILVPHVVSSYWLRIVTFVMFAVVLASSFNIISGFTGYVSFGQAAFVGIGAYTSLMLLLVYNFPYPVTLPIAGGMAVVIAVLLGIPLFRLDGHYFAITTFLIQLAFAALVTSISELGGGQGVVSYSVWPYMNYYYVMSLLAVGAVVVTYYIRRSYFGIRLLAINSNETQAESLGVPTTRYKLIAFGISAFFLGVAGGVYGNYVAYIDPTTVFSVQWSIESVLYTLTGGIGTVFGPVIGAVLLSVVNQILGSMFLFLDRLMFGLLIILVITFFPNGILGIIRSRLRDGDE